MVFANDSLNVNRQRSPNVTVYLLVIYFYLQTDQKSKQENKTLNLNVLKINN